MAFCTSFTYEIYHVIRKVVLVGQ